MPLFTRCEETRESHREFSPQNNLAQFSHFEDQVTKTQRAKMFGDIFYWWLGGAHP